MSMSWSLNGGIPIGLSLVSGIAVVRALRESGLSSAELKWPNDVLVDGQKLCGILVELTSNRCVIGIGLNLDLGDGPGVDVDYPWTDFVRLDLDFDRDRIAADLMFHHEILVKQCLNSGFAGFVDDWNALHYFKNKTVEVSKDGETFCGRALGVDKLGTLIVETKEGLRQLSSAERVFGSSNPLLITIFACAPGFCSSWTEVIHFIR